MDASLHRAAPLASMEEVFLTLASAAGPVNILRGVSLTIGNGESLGLVGPSGSGKTSLLMVLAGLERATSGRVMIAGQELGALGEDALALLRRTHIGIVFQSYHLIATMTALENVAIPLELAGARDAFARAAAGLAEVGLSHRLKHFPAQLSGGEQQRVAIARAFVAGPSLLIADEPTGNLDAENGRLVVDCLFAQRARLGASLFLITHDPSLAARCGRQIRLAEGRIVEERAVASADRAQRP